MEDQEISEIFFVLEGLIGIGFSRLTFSKYDQLKVAIKYGINQMIGEHYVMNCTRSDFVYIALKPTRGFALSLRHIKSLRDDFLNEIIEIKSNTR